tara:strand:- start:399 stop:887 length:489 start_codon:yes stop_codon:yes gene_type:complete
LIFFGLFGIEMNKNFISLTDLHAKLGGENRKKPSLFLRRFSELRGIEAITKSGRHGGGTWASPRVAEYYTKWASDYCDEMHLRAYCQKESAALSTIEQLLSIKLDKQFSVGKYRVDGYDEINNTVYEIDENHHKKTQQRIKDKDRQREITKALGCSFIRIKV